MSTRQSSVNRLPEATNIHNGTQIVGDVFSYAGYVLSKERERLLMPRNSCLQNGFIFIASIL
jgi:hypothetical protein